MVNIEEGNKLIAEFMDVKHITGINNRKLWANIVPECVMERYSDDYCLKYTDECNEWQYKFDKSWEWLMPVVEKIDKLGYDVEINSGLRRINIRTTDFGYMEKVPEYNEEFRGNSSLYADLTPIQCVYQAIVEFIQWYNEQKK